MVKDCVFCRIVAKELPADIVYEDNEILAFRDIHPVATTHILIIPRKHIGSVADLTEKDVSIVDRMVLAANKLAKQEGIFDRGFRLVLNTGKEGGQLVPHLHMHLIGGRRLKDQLG